MDPTTSGHIDPATLTTSSTGPDSIPSLNVKPTPSPQTTTSGQYSSSTSSTTTNDPNPTATGIRQRVNKIGNQLDQASDHPAVKNAKGAANKQVDQLRQTLGQFGVVRDLEARTGVDRVILVVGGALAYLILVPLNLFGLALPTTNLLTFLPPTLLAATILDRNKSTSNEDSTKALLAYFVVLGFVQFIESLAAGVLAKTIPQYYTVKLILLAYLAHPRTRGAIQVHEKVFRPLLARATAPTSQSSYTPPTSNPSKSTDSSPVPSASKPYDLSTAGSSASNGNTSGGNVHLPSGGGSGVGLEVPKDPIAAPNVGMPRQEQATGGFVFGSANTGNSGNEAVGQRLEDVMDRTQLR